MRNAHPPRPMYPLLAMVLVLVVGAMRAAVWAQTSAAAEQPPSTRPAEPRDWACSWACGVQTVEPKNLAPRPGLSGNVLRQVVHLSVGGPMLRVRLSNEFGNGPLVIASAHIAVSNGGSKIDVASDRPLTFGGQGAVTVPPGAPMLSDPAPLPVGAAADVAVTLHLGSVPSNVTGHPGSRCTSYLQAGGDAAMAEMPAGIAIQHWYLLSGIDVAATADPASIVVLGDSITDGRGSGTDRNDRWPDNLERRLAAAGGQAADIGVLNEGIGGNRLLNDGLGPSMLARFDRDVAAHGDARWLIVLAGINDIGTGRDSQARQTAASIIAAYQQIIARAHAQHLRVYGATLLPFDGSFYATAARLAEWQQVNDWIRSANQFDAVIDYAAAMRDPDHPTHLSPGLDSGDHLHPNEAGYRQMADAIDLKLFAR